MQTIEEIKQKAEPILKAAGVTRSALFGSAARGEMTEESDIDILIDPPENMGFFGLAHLALDLEKKLGKSVDLVTYEALHPLLKSQILADEEVIF